MKQTNELKSFMEGFAEADNALEFKMGHECDVVEKLSTGSHALDNILFGGIPKGRITQFFGPAGSGKSFAAMLCIKQAQIEDPSAMQLFIDAEQTFNADWCEQIGIDVQKIGVLDGESASDGKQCFERLLGIPKEDKAHLYIGKNKYGLLDKIINKEINVNLIILDSLGSIIPPIEAVAQVGKQSMSPLARFLTPTFKKLSVEVAKAKVPFIVINHVKDNMDPFAGKSYTYSGGNSYTHHLSANLYFEAVTRKDSVIFNDKEQKVGQTIRAVTEKLKQGPWPRKCEFRVAFDSGVIDLHEEIANLALEWDIISRPTNLSYEYGTQKWVGAPKFIEALKNDSALQAELLVKIREARDAKISSKRAAELSSAEEVESTDPAETGKRGRKKT